jgi:hypothetical protein
MRQYFFSLWVTDMWNSLPDSIVDAPSMNAFKNWRDEAMQEHMFSHKMPSSLRTGNKSSSYLHQSSVMERSGFVVRIPCESSHEKFKNRQQAMGHFFDADTFILL